MRAGVTAILSTAMVASCSLFTDSGNLTNQPAPPADGSVNESDAPVAADGSVGPSPEASAVDAAPSYRDVVLSDGPIAYFPFDDAPGVSFTRDVVGGKLATVVAKATFGAPGAVNGAVAFDGTGALDVGDVLDLVGEAPFSLEVWVKASAGRVVHKRDEGVNPFNGYVLYVDDDASTIKFEVWYAGGSRNGWASVSADRYSHVVCAFDGQELRLFVDSILIPTAYSSPGGATDHTLPLQIGDGLVGEIDELAFYDKPLSVEQVRKHFDAQKR